MKTDKIVLEFCEEHGLTVEQFYGKEKYNGSLNLENVTTLPESFNPTVGGSLNLENVTTLPESFNPTVGGSLYLESVTALPESFNPNVGGDLNLESVTALPESFNPTVGGSLYLPSVTTLPESFNPTVGGSLYLESVTTLPESFNPTVGGSLYLRSKLSAETKKPTSNLINWGKWIMADGIFTEVISKRGNVYKVKRLNNDKVFYLVTNGGFVHAHGDTLKQAKDDFKFKHTQHLLKNKPITMDTVIDIPRYRAITGACESGVNWFKSENKLDKPSYLVSELLPILERKNAYGLEAFKKLIKND
jgi:hypothetical protein